MNDVTDFFESYRATWEVAKDVAPMSRFFHFPTTVVGSDGVPVVLNSQADLEKFNQTRLVHFRESKISRWLLRGCDAMLLGQKSVFAIVNWEGQRADSTIVMARRYCYNLVRTSDGLKIVLSTVSASS